MNSIRQCMAFNRAVRTLNRLDSFGGLCSKRNLSQKINGKASYVIAATDLHSFKALNEQIKANPFISKRSKASFDSRLISHAYRLGGAEGGEARLEEPDPEMLGQVTELAIKWKNKQIMFDAAPEGLSEQQIEQLEEIARYPKILSQLLKNPRKLATYFKWTIRRPLSSRVFAEFPPIAQKIGQCFLKARISAFRNGEGLQLVEKDGKKDVTMLVEGKPVSILNGCKKVQFTDGPTRTINSIFKTFQNKELDEGDLTYFEDGVHYFDPNLMCPRTDKFGNQQQLDLEVPNWHRQMPMKAHMTAAEATEYFGFPCDGTNGAMTVVATRQKRILDTFGSHSFIRLLIPRGDGTYDYTFGWGKFTKQYPQNPLHAVTFLFMPKKWGTLQYIDNNEIYYRQKKETHFNLSPEKVQACLNSFKYDIEQSRIGNFPFQILILNCTDWVISKVKKFVGPEEAKMFDICYLDLQPTGFLGMILKVLRKAADWIRRAVLTTFAILLGGCARAVITRKNGTKKTISVLKTPPWDLNRPFRHPGVIFQKPKEIAAVDPIDVN